MHGSRDLTFNHVTLVILYCIGGKSVLRVNGIMGKTCCVDGCVMRSDKDKSIKFFPIPCANFWHSKEQKSCRLGDKANGYPKSKGKTGRLRHTIECVLFTLNQVLTSRMYQIKLHVLYFFQECLPLWKTSVIQIGYQPKTWDTVQLYQLAIATNDLSVEQN